MDSKNFLIVRRFFCWKLQTLNLQHVYTCAKVYLKWVGSDLLASSLSCVAPGDT